MIGDLRKVRVLHVAVSKIDLIHFVGGHQGFMNYIYTQFRREIEKLGYPFEYYFNLEKNMHCIGTPLRIGYKKHIDAQIIMWEEADQIDSPWWVGTKFEHLDEDGAFHYGN